MKKLSLGIFFISMASLVTELSLIRVFDVLFYPNIAYMIITCALFGFGIAGVYAILKPISEHNINRALASWAVMFSVFTLLILPVMNWLPIDLNKLSVEPVSQLIYLFGMYFLLVLPFFIVGLIFTNIFSNFASRIQLLYFSDLIGAAIGSIILIPILPYIGPGGMLFVSAALGFFASAFFSEGRTWKVVALACSFLLVLGPVLRSPAYFDFKEHQDKRGIKLAREKGMIEKTIWDPVSKIDVIDYGDFKYIAYDGGSQNSIYYPFDGDLKSLRDNIDTNLNDNFWQRGVLASHYLKRDTGQKVLVIGSAGGQEIKAALMYGASRVDGVEMIRAVVDLGRSDYSSYIGDLFNHPNANIIVGEGRSYLRASDEIYDVIQIFSNHTSSSIAAGTGAMATNYLQTVEAYKEYFTHLSDNGILQVNHHIYPKMITTAAVAWSELGRTDLQKHVVVFTRYEEDTLPTFLVKMQPWTDSELLELKNFFSASMQGDPDVYHLVEDPLVPEHNRLNEEFYKSDLSKALLEEIDYRIVPATDNRPYFNFLEKTFLLNANDITSLRDGSLENAPIVKVSFSFIGVVSLIYGVMLILIPLLFSEVGKLKWPNKAKTLIYFSCLGAGFIIIEFVFIQVFMQLIGSPLHTYSSVIFVILFSAGVGSFISSRVGISPAKRWYIPFVGILISGFVLIFLRHPIFQIFLASPLYLRILIASLLMFPVGFFLGMPFPLGILVLQYQPRGSIAWAWGMNALFTVAGGLFGVLLSIQYGFRSTLIIALVIYILAMLVFSRIRPSISSQG